MGRYFKKTPKEEVCKPVHSAPRGKCERHSSLNKNLFKKFKKTYPNIKIDWETFKEIIIRGNEIFREGFLENREGVVLPEGLGKLFIGAYEKSPNSPYYDWGLLMNKNIVASHRNYESDRYFCKLFYTNFGDQYKYPFKRFWYFNPMQETSALVSKYFREDFNKYIKVPKFQKMKDLEKELYRTIKIVHHEPNSGRIDFTDTQPH